MKHGVAFLYISFMDKIIIGIDISLNSSGFCIISKDKVHHISGLNTRKFTTAAVVDMDKILDGRPYLKLLLESTNGLEINFNERHPMKKKDGQYLNGRKRLRDCTQLSKAFYLDIIKALDTHFNGWRDADIHIGIEDYSYGKDTDNTVQVVEISTSLKNRLTRNIQSDFEKYHIVSAPEVKMFAGKGNYDKWQMVEAYIKLADPAARKTDLFKLLHKDASLFYNEKSKMKYAPKLKKKIDTPFKEVFSPIDDLVDAYWVAKWTEHRINNKIANHL